MSGHSKEPWKLVADGEFVSIIGTDIVLPEMRRIHCEKDFIRIVACVNACAEIPTEDLEESSMSILQYMEDQYGEKLEASQQQRDELLAAAKAVVERWDTPLWKNVPSTAEYIGSLRTAISKAEAA